ncbi:MAG: LacI family transcriptional regulator [Firmicutes bacterium]|nr:LacI family transcriptional regulator [Bacillota bacterium]
MANIKDVAKLANTSISTVSRVINDTSYVKEETKKRVIKAMKELNYKPLLREPIKKENKTIGLIVPDITNPFFSKIAKEIASVANHYDYNITLCNIDGIPESEDDYLMDLIENRVDGVIYASSYRSVEVLKRVKEKNIPIVVLDRNMENYAISSVAVNNNQGAFLATEHLIKLGHEKIAFIEGFKDFQISKHRKKGFKRALSDYNLNLDEDLIKRGDFTMESGFKAMKEIINSKKDFTAVIAINDLMAIGASNCLNQLGIKTPEDVSVVGFDNILLASTITPKLTTVAYPIEKMSERAIKLLMKQISNKDISPEMVTLFPKLIVRESTKKI